MIAQYVIQDTTQIAITNVQAALMQSQTVQLAIIQTLALSANQDTIQQTLLLVSSAQQYLNVLIAAKRIRAAINVIQDTTQIAITNAQAALMHSRIVQLAIIQTLALSANKVTFYRTLLLVSSAQQYLNVLIAAKRIRAVTHVIQDITQIAFTSAQAAHSQSQTALFATTLTRVQLVNKDIFC